MSSSSSKTTALPTFEEIAATARETFRQTFGSEPELSCCAPGRVNLIGEHVDYNDGYVLPMALPMVTLIVGGRRPDNDVDIITCCSSADEPRRIKFSLLQQLQPAKPQWANYVKGVISNFLKIHPTIRGFNAVVISNVPVGAGLSSSAALEVATLTFLEQLSGNKLESNAQRAKLCQAAEHEFAGVPCGIMDQMISVSGQRGHAFLLDCQSGVGVQTKFQSDSVVVLICNSNVKHELSHSEYPTRRKQCFKALEQMALKSYRDATIDNLAALTNLADSVEQQLLYKRARHVITEIKRTQEAYHALQQHDFKKMGQLMQESHKSLRDDFAVSCPEIDTLVAVANSCAGVYGSRMTGGGFGGCTVTLVDQTAVDQVISEMIKEFSSAYNVNAQQRLEFYIATPSDGARSLA